MPWNIEKLAYVVVLKLFPDVMGVQRSEFIFMEIYKLGRPTSIINSDLGMRPRVFQLPSASLTRDLEHTC